MKVLFAIGSDQLSKNIADKYYEKFGEVLEYKNVFFFKALIEEVKNNKTYDRIVINEDFEEFRTKDLEQLDRVIFNYIDKITDETQDTDIILICSNRRNKGDSFVSKVFSIGIYNLLIGDDRNINPLCDIVKKPRTKREAKAYLNIDTSLITDNPILSDNEVDENQVRSILSYYEGIRNQPEKFLTAFDQVAEQYSRVQLKIIVEYLPKYVKEEIFKADRYRYLAPQEDEKTNQKSANVNKVEAAPQEKKGGLFSVFKNRHKPDPKQNIGKIDMGEMQTSGKVDLSSDEHEQKIATVQAEAKVIAEENRIKEQQMLEAKAREEAKIRAEQEAKKQAELEARAKAEAEIEKKRQAELEKRRQEELANKAKAEIEARKQAELEAKARAEAEARRLQEEAEARKRQAEAEAKRMQEEHERKIKEEAAQKEQELLMEKAKAEARARAEAEASMKAASDAKEQKSLQEQARAEALAREKKIAEAKAQAQSNNIITSNTTGGADIPKSAPGSIVEIKPNPNAPQRQTNKLDIPVAPPAPSKPKVEPTISIAESIPSIPNTPKVDIQVGNTTPSVSNAVSPVMDAKPSTVNTNPSVINNIPNNNVPKETNVTPNVQSTSGVNNIEKPVTLNTVQNVNILKNTGVNMPNSTVPTGSGINVPNVHRSQENDIKNQYEPKINITTDSGAAPKRVNTYEIKNEQVTDSFVSEQEKRMKEEQEKLAMEQKKIREAQEKLEEEKRKLREEQEKLASAQTQLKNESTGYQVPQYANTQMPAQIAPVPNYKKMVVFVGANKVGTTFVTNAVAHTVASNKIVTSVIDMTRDRSLYYIYADESKTLKNRAAECMQRLSEGEDYFIETVNSHLKLYTAVAGNITDQRRGYKHRTIIDTVKNNCTLTIVDADFTTPIDYFDQADEIYLIQDLDILKIQDVTLFLRELNARGLDKKKIRLIINKFVKTSITPKIIIGALDFYHDPGGTYVDSGLMPSKVDFSTIPYNLNNYAKYVESLHKMSGNFNYKSYSADFIQAISEIVGKVYPSNQAKTKKFFG